MADNETPMFTTTQVFKMLADSMQSSADVVENCESVTEARTILYSRAIGARELAYAMENANT